VKDSIKTKIIELYKFLLEAHKTITGSYTKNNTITIFHCLLGLQASYIVITFLGWKLTLL